MEIRLENLNGVEMVAIQLDNGKVYHYNDQNCRWYGLRNQVLTNPPKAISKSTQWEVRDYKNAHIYDVENKPLLTYWRKRVKSTDENEVTSFLDRLDSILIQNEKGQEQVKKCLNDWSWDYLNSNGRENVVEKINTLNSDFKNYCAYGRNNDNFSFLNYLSHKELIAWLAQNQFKINELYTEDFYKKAYRLYKRYSDKIENPNLFVFYLGQLAPLCETYKVTEDVGGYTDLRYGHVETIEIGSIFNKNTVETMLYDFYNMVQKIDYTPTKNNFLKEYQKVRLFYKEQVQSGMGRDKEIEKAQNLKYAYENDEIMVIVPTTAKQFAQESVQQRNCVYAYHVRHVIDKDENIVFIRKKSDTEKSWLTCSIDPETNETMDILGYSNNYPTEKDERMIRPYLEYLKTLNKE